MLSQYRILVRRTARGRVRVRSLSLPSQDKLSQQLPLTTESPAYSVNVNIDRSGKSDATKVRQWVTQMEPHLTATSYRKQTDLNYSPPAHQLDFKNQSLVKEWSKTIEANFWSSIWQPCQPSASGDISHPDGIAYRLPDMKMAAANYHPSEGSTAWKQSWLQFRSPQDLYMMKEATGAVMVRKEITWGAFPQRLKTAFRGSKKNTYEIVEKNGWPAPATFSEEDSVSKPSYLSTARQMDEYCEWYTHRAPAMEEGKPGNITRIDITCESPEYWEFLATRESKTALELYRKYISPDVKMEDLGEVVNGRIVRYNPYNKWNTTHGAMHLNCPPNSLFAEIYTAAEASVRWGKGGVPVTTEQDLMKHGQYGLNTRSSDVTIGANVNALIRELNMIVSIDNPVGVYLKDLDTSRWRDPDGKPFTQDQLAQIVTYQRGSRNHSRNHPGSKTGSNCNLRIKVEIPEAWGYTLGQCSISGAKINWAGQLIDASAAGFLTIIGIDGEEAGLLPTNEKPPVVESKDEWTWNTQTSKVVGPVFVGTSPVPNPYPEITLE